MLRPVVLTAFALCSTAALASEPEPSWASWSLEVTGDDGVLDARLDIQVGGDEVDGTPVVLSEDSVGLDCRAIGAAGVRGDVLRLDGGVFVCGFPDVVDAANTLIADKWGPDQTLLEGSTGVCEPMELAYTEMVVSPKMEGFAPVFEHPSVRLGLEQWGNELESRLYFGGRTGVSKQMAAGDATLVQSQFICDQPGADCQFEHVIGGDEAGENRVSSFAPRMRTTETMIRIGGNRSAKFQGTIEQLVIDPGCRVR